MSFWPNQDHWSVKIPLTSDHYRMPILDDTGVVELAPMPTAVPASEWESLEYMDWKSGGDTNFAPIASADGELDCRGFWDKGKTDKDALWTSNAATAPTLRDYVGGVGANFGRVRITRLCPTLTPLTSAYLISVLRFSRLLGPEKLSLNQGSSTKTPGWNCGPFLYFFAALMMPARITSPGMAGLPSPSR